MCRQCNIFIDTRLRVYDDNNYYDIIKTPAERTRTLPPPPLPSHARLQKSVFVYVHPVITAHCCCFGIRHTRGSRRETRELRIFPSHDSRIPFFYGPWGREEIPPVGYVVRRGRVRGGESNFLMLCRRRTGGGGGGSAAVDYHGGGGFVVWPSQWRRPSSWPGRYAERSFHCCQWCQCVGPSRRRSYFSANGAFCSRFRFVSIFFF